MPRKLRALVRPKNDLDTLEDYQEFMRGLFKQMGLHEPEPTPEQWKKDHIDFLQNREGEVPAKTW